METQIKAFYHSPKGIKILTIFGYATKGIPSLEINGAGKLSRNIKEKLIFITRNRQLSIPTKRFVICVDLNDQIDKEEEYLKWLEFPLLLTYWYLAGLVPIKKLDNCLSSGWIRASGEVFHPYTSELDRRRIEKKLPPEVKKNTLVIGRNETCISSEMLLEHIPGLKFKYDRQISKIDELVS